MKRTSRFALLILVLCSGQILPEDTPATPRVDSLGDPLPVGVVARMGSGRMRHGDAIRALAFSPDGKRLVSGELGGVKVWDLATGKALRELHLDAGWGIQFAHAADALVVASSSSKTKTLKVHVLDSKTLQIKNQFDLAVETSTFALGQEGKSLAVSTQEHVTLYDTTNGQMVFQLTGYARDLAFTGDGKQLVTCNLKDTVRVHDVANGKVSRELKHEGDQVVQVAVSRDGKLLMSSSSNDDRTGDLTIWDLTTGIELYRRKSPKFSYYSAAFSPDGKKLAVRSREALMLWEAKTGKELRSLSDDWFGSPLVFAPDGQTLAAAGGSAMLLWDLNTGERLPLSTRPAIYVRALRFVSQDKELFGYAEVPFVWDGSTGKELRRLPAIERPYFYFTCFSDDVRLFAHPGPENVIVVGDVKSGRQMLSLTSDQGFGRRTQFSANARQVFSGGFDKTVRVWDLATAKETHKLTGHTEPVDTLACSPDGRLLASHSSDASAGGDHSIRLWDLDSGNELRKFLPQRGTAFAIAFAPDSKLIAACGGEPGRPNDRGDVQVWDVASGRELRSFGGHKERVTCLAFSPDGRSLATGALDKQLILWEIASGKERRRFVGHNSSVNSVAFSSDGRRLAASSPDAPVYIWDVTGLLLEPKAKLTADGFAEAWSNLSGEDAAKAFAAIRLLASDPEHSVAFLREHLKPAKPLDSKHVEKLIAQLDSAKFGDRQQAAAELAKLGEQVESALQKTLKSTASPEVRRQIETLLVGMDRPGAESLRQIRAVEALEWTASPEALQLLNELANGGPEARLTREAVAARKRLTGRTP